MNESEFLQACQTVMAKQRSGHGIGTLGEKMLHAVLKAYFDPNPEHHEAAAGPYIADIRNERGFVEIQTRNFYRLREKLHFLLGEAPVTVVYPIPAIKWVVWLEEDGKASPKRKSPKRAGPWEILPELYGIKPLLGSKGLHFCIVLLEVEEYRLKNGWSEDGKRGASRFDRYPIRLLDEIWLNRPEEYGLLIPNSLSEPFTAKEFGKAARLSPKKSSAAIQVLLSVGAVTRVGKRKNAYLYNRNNSLEL